MWFKVIVCGPVCGIKKEGKLEKRRKRGMLEVRVEETRPAAVPPPMFLALGVCCCFLFKGSLASLAWASA